MEKLDGVRYLGCGHNSEVFVGTECTEYCGVCGTSIPVTPIDIEGKAYHAEASVGIPAYKFVLRKPEVYCTKCATLQTSGLHIPKM